MSKCIEFTKKHPDMTIGEMCEEILKLESLLVEALRELTEAAEELRYDPSNGKLVAGQLENVIAKLKEVETTSSGEPTG